jgi:hypothetical protein
MREPVAELEATDGAERARGDEEHRGGDGQRCEKRPAVKHVRIYPARS